VPEERDQRADFLSLEKALRRERVPFGWMPELRRLRQLEDENSKLKQPVADLSLDKAMLKEVVSKKL